ncbi:hypothetical protein IOD13_16095 [Brevibacterium casei]|nr:hypothetical protein [Brevibacterium casei]
MPTPTRERRGSSRSSPPPRSTSRPRPRMPWTAGVAKRLRAIETGEVTAPGTTQESREITEELAKAVRALTSSATSAPIL